jgi:hypothetical protein
MEGCHPKRLIFVDGQYAGPELSPEGLLTDQGLRVGMDPIDLVRAGVVPHIIGVNADVTGKGIWGIRFQDQSKQEYAMFIFFSGGRLENWFVTPVRNLPKELFEKPNTLYEMTQLIVIIGQIATTHGTSGSSGPGGCGFCGFGFAQ